MLINTSRSIGIGTVVGIGGFVMVVVAGATVLVVGIMSTAGSAAGITIGEDTVCRSGSVWVDPRSRRFF